MLKFESLVPLLPTCQTRRKKWKMKVYGSRGSNRLTPGDNGWNRTWQHTPKTVRGVFGRQCSLSRWCKNRFRRDSPSGRKILYTQSTCSCLRFEVVHAVNGDDPYLFKRFSRAFPTFCSFCLFTTTLHVRRRQQEAIVPYELVFVSHLTWNGIVRRLFVTDEKVFFVREPWFWVKFAWKCMLLMRWGLFS